MLTFAVATSALTATPAVCEPISAVRFELDEHGGIIVPVTIGGAGPFRFLLDTGASGSSISEVLATRIDAPIVAKTDVTTPAGHTTMFVAAMRGVKVGIMSSERILAVTVPADALAPAGAGVVGVLGQDFLGPHNYTLDYRRHMLVWDGDGANAAVGSETVLRLVPENGQFLVELPQGDSPVVRMVPDSGADSLVLFARPETRLPVTDAGTMQLSGMVGTRTATKGTIRQLEVGSITLRNQPVVAVKLDDGDPHAGDGLLPLHHFASVSFHSSGYIVFRR
jgi:predicted aspartyl protease